MRTWNSMNGLNSMSYLLKVLVIVMVLFTTSGLADTEEKNNTLTLEFLEFLADWETDQGEWAGPDSFVDDSFDQLYEVQVQDNEEQNEE